MNTIKGYRNHSYESLLRCNATPWLRLHFFKAVGATLAGQYWKNARANMNAPEVSALSPGFNMKSNGERYPIMHTFDGPQFRNEAWADEVDGVRMDHRGWFNDADCISTLRAFVYSLPHGRFGCGYADSDTGARVYLLEVHKDASSAAQSADYEARYHAEEEQRYSERWSEACILRDAIAELKEDTRRMFALRNMGTFEYCREEVRDNIDAIREKQKELKTDYSDIEGELQP